MGDITSCCQTVEGVFPVLEMPIDREFIKNIQPVPQFIEMPPNVRALIDNALQSEYAQGLKDTSLNLSQEQTAYPVFHAAAKKKDKQEVKTETVFYRGRQFSQNMPLNGYGVVYFPRQQYFEGILLNSRPKIGVFVFDSLDYYVGEFRNECAQGKGKYVDEQTGHVYEGSWAKSLPHGKGKDTYQNGDFYEGEYIYGCKYGIGKYNFAGVRVYEGSFYNNKSDGYGKMVWANRNTYEGEWRLGKMHGKGSYTWSNGDSYKGEFEDGLRHGTGTYIFARGIRYEGGWERGLQHGKGIIKQGSDEVVGEWLSGVKVEE